MGKVDEYAYVTVVVSPDVKDRLKESADNCDKSLNQYVAAVLTQSEYNDGGPTEVRRVRYHNGSTEVTLPPEIATSIGVDGGDLLAFAPIPGGAIIWRPR